MHGKTYKKGHNNDYSSLFYPADREGTIWLSECSYEYQEVTWQRWGESEKNDNERGMRVLEVF
jgi:hypothetical protein